MSTETFLGAFFNNLFMWLKTPFTWLLDGVIYVLGYTLYFMFQGFLTIVKTLILALDLTSFSLDFVAQLSGLPPALTYLLANTGFTQGLTLIAGAYGLRMLLNLIPAEFTRI